MSTCPKCGALHATTAHTCPPITTLSGYRTDTIDQAVARACLEPTLLKALNWIAIWETERVVKQVLEWQRTGVRTGSNGGAWDTCFEFCFEQVMNKWAGAGTVTEALSVREACRRRQAIGVADAQALEHALTITERERDEAKSDAYVRALLIASGASPPEATPWFCSRCTDDGYPCAGCGKGGTFSAAVKPSTEAQPLAWDDDRPLPEDEAIDAAFPTRSGRHDTYQEAMRMVGAKRSKGALVSLVNWLLIKAEKPQR